MRNKRTNGILTIQLKQGRLPLKKKSTNKIYTEDQNIYKKKRDPSVKSTDKYYNNQTVEMFKSIDFQRGLSTERSVDKLLVSSHDVYYQPSAEADN
jgi:hypothetical protein